jgi:hypothetical protein
MSNVQDVAVGAAFERKRRWDKPKMDRIKAGDAEIGTREVAGDGPFTSS